MQVLIVGSIALDHVATPGGEVRDVLGGSAVYASLAAGQFAETGLVGVVGRDFPETHIALLRRRGIRLDGLERAEGETFRWRGIYRGDMSCAETLDTKLNVFADFRPAIPETFRTAPYVFLANIHPALQASVLDQVADPRFVLLDTMNYWIANAREELLAVLGRVHGVVLNDEEARQLTGEAHLIPAGRWIQSHGPRLVLIKKGEHGVLALHGEDLWALPALPLAHIKDPTGAGDTFAGGFMGSLAAADRLDDTSLRRATAVATVMASFTVEEFSVGAIADLTRAALASRYEGLRRLSWVPAEATADAAVFRE